jgi:hypothetical protein
MSFALVVAVVSIRSAALDRSPGLEPKGRNPSLSLLIAGPPLDSIGARGSESWV